MERRELLKMIALLTGGYVVGGEMLLSGCNPGSASPQTYEPFPWPKLQEPPAFLTAEQMALLNEVGETIIPTTDTPGAKAADVARLMNAIVADCYTPAQQKAFTDGITQLQEACKKKHGKGFMECDAKQRQEFLVGLEKEAKAFNANVNAEEGKRRQEMKTKTWQEQLNFESSPRHYYTMMKQLTLLGYFTSEIGATKALRNNPVPGKYDGSAPYKPGEKAWA